MKKCPHCGKMNLDKADICKECQCEINNVAPGTFYIKSLLTGKRESYCTNCGKKLSDSSKFCSQCGCRVKKQKPQVIYTVIKEIDIYKEHLEPAWEYPNPDDQWIFAETINEYVRTEYNVLYVYDDNTYKESCGYRFLSDHTWEISRGDLSYDDTKRRLKRRWF